MNKNKLTDEQCTNILKSLDEAIAGGPWEASNFLKMIGKNLVRLRDDFLAEVDAMKQPSSAYDLHLAQRMALTSGHKEVFVLLYSSDGGTLQTWERIIANLPKQMISRPIYAAEENVINILKTKENKVNEAYVSLYVHPDNILPISPDKVSTDKLGQKLLVLKDKAVHLDKISRFVHLSVAYRWEHGHLVKN